MPSDDELALLAGFRETLPPEIFEQPFNFPTAGNDTKLRQKPDRSQAAARVCRLAD